MPWHTKSLIRTQLGTVVFLDAPALQPPLNDCRDLVRSYLTRRTRSYGLFPSVLWVGRRVCPSRHLKASCAIQLSLPSLLLSSSGRTWRVRKIRITPSILGMIMTDSSARRMYGFRDPATLTMAGEPRSDEFARDFASTKGVLVDRSEEEPRQRPAASNAPAGLLGACRRLRPRLVLDSLRRPRVALPLPLFRCASY